MAGLNEGDGLPPDCFIELDVYKRQLFIRSNRFLRSRRQFNFISEPKSLINLINQLHNALDFLHHLFFPHKNMGIVLHKTTCSHRPMQCYGFFISMNKSFNQFKIIIKSIFNCRTNGTFRIRIKTVSYTHLDVYKRQSLPLARAKVRYLFSSIFIRILSFAARYRISPGFLPHIRLPMADNKMPSAYAPGLFPGKS